MGEGVLKVIDLLGLTVAGLQAEIEMMRRQMEVLNQALADRPPAPEAGSA